MNLAELRAEAVRRGWRPSVDYAGRSWWSAWRFPDWYAAVVQNDWGWSARVRRGVFDSPLDPMLSNHKTEREALGAALGLPEDA